MYVLLDDNKCVGKKREIIFLNFYIICHIYPRQSIMTVNIVLTCYSQYISQLFFKITANQISVHHC